jgi:hypothetical protein
MFLARKILFKFPSYKIRKFTYSYSLPIIFGWIRGTYFCLMHKAAAPLGAKPHL